MTVGDMTPGELLESARSEIHGLRELIERVTSETDDALLVNAYLVSVESRLIVAQSKLEAGEAL